VKRLFLASCLVVSSVALADKASVDAYLTKQCQDAKDAVGQHAGACDEEIKAFSAVDCTNKEQRKTVAPNALEIACKHKVKGDTGAAKSDASVPCRAVDDKGEVLAETTAEAAYKCNEALKPLVVSKCAPKQVILSYTLLSTIGGKEHKLKGTANCSAR
jgi:hypothetical protein